MLTRKGESTNRALTWFKPFKLQLFLGRFLRSAEPRLLVQKPPVTLRTHDWLHAPQLYSTSDELVTVSWPWRALGTCPSYYQGCQGYLGICFVRT